MSAYIDKDDLNEEKEVCDYKRMSAQELIEKAELVDYPENGAFIIATVDQEGKVNMNGFGDMRMIREFGVLLIERCAEQRLREGLAKAIVQH